MNLHGSPGAVELVEAVREWIEHDVLASAEGRTKFHARVAARMLATVERELNLSHEQLAAYDERRAGLGYPDEASLAAAIRAGDLDDRFDEVHAVLRADVDARLAVANPTYADDSA